MLHDILQDCMNPDITLYARVVAHVQSSGTGKSRTHDELAKHILYIPLNLAAADADSMLSFCALLSLYSCHLPQHIHPVILQ